MNMLISVISILFLVFLVILGFYFAFKQRLLSRSVVKSIKANIWGFITLTLFFAGTMSIVSGSMIAADRSYDAVETLFKDGNIYSSFSSVKGLDVNQARIKNFHKKDVEGYVGDVDNENENRLDFKAAFGNEDYNHWNTKYDNVPNFEEWATTSFTWELSKEEHKPIGGTKLGNKPTEGQLEYYIFNVGDYYSHENRVAMLLYTFDVIHNYGFESQVDDKYSIGVGEFGWSFKFEANGTINNPNNEQWIYNPDTNQKQSYGKTRITMIPDINDPFYTTVKSQASGNEYLVNRLTPVLGEELITDGDFIQLADDEFIIYDNFYDWNNMKLNQTYQIKSEPTSENLEPIEKDMRVVGTGYIPSEVNRSGLFDSEINQRYETNIFVNKKTFNELMYGSYKRNGVLEITRPTNLDELLTSKVDIQIFQATATYLDAINDGSLGAIDSIETKEGTDKYKSIAFDYSEEISKTFIMYFNHTDNGIVPPSFSEEGNNNIKDTNISRIFIPTSNSTYDVSNTGMEKMLTQLKLQTFTNKDMMLIFLVINIVVILVFVKRKIHNEKKTISTLKSLGYKSSILALTFLLYPILIGAIGSIVGIFLGMFIQRYWLNFSAGSFAVNYGGPQMTFGIFSISMLVPMLIIILIMFIIIYKNLKTSTVSGLSGESTYKNNFLIRKWDDHVNKKDRNKDKTFIRQYKVKNVLRSFGKSSFIFVTVIGSSFIFIFGSAFSTWGQTATKATQAQFGDAEIANWYYDPSNEGYEPIEFELEEVIDQEIESGIITPYTFGDSEASMREVSNLWKHPLNDNSKNKTIDERKKAWSDNVGHYLATETLDNRYIYHGLLQNDDEIDVQPLIDSILILLGNIVKDQDTWSIKLLSGWVGGIILNPTKGIVTILEDIFYASRITTINDDFFYYRELGWSSKKVLWSPKDERAFSQFDFIRQANNIVDSFINILGDLTISDDGFATQWLHTMVLGSQLNGLGTPNPEISFTSNGKDYKININEVSSTMTTLLVYNIVGSLTNKTIDSILKSIVDGSEVTITFKESYITPGKVGYGKKDAPFSFTLSPSNGFDGNVNPVWTYGDKALDNAPDLNAILGGDLKTSFKQYSQENNDGSKLDQPLYIPMYIDAVWYWSEMNSTLLDNTTQTLIYPSSKLDWTKEAHYNENTNNLDINLVNDEATWIYKRFEDSHYIKPTTNPHNHSFSTFTKTKKTLPSGEKVLWQIPVKFKNDIDSIQTAESFGINGKAIGVYETYFRIGSIVYQGDNGMNDFMIGSPYNAIAKVPENNNDVVEYFGKYQSAWSQNLTHLPKEERFLLNDTASGTVSPIETFGVPLPLPIPVSTVSSLVETTYKPFTNLMSFFTIAAYIIVSFMLIILTKDILDDTKNETSVLKAMGYKNKTTTGVVMNGQIAIIFTSFLVSIPIAMKLLGVVGAKFTELAGLQFFLETQVWTLWMAAGIMGLIAIILYIVVYFLSKKISPLLTTNE